MITKEHIKEGLSRAYAYAVSYKAGMNCIIDAGYDYKIDGTFRDIATLPDGKRFDTGFVIDFQLKASKNVQVKEEKIVYDLEVGNYNHLASKNVGSERILILFKLPDNEDEWLNISEESTVLKNCAWWCSLKGSPISTNLERKRIEIPRNQIMNPDSLIRLMETVKTGGKL